MIIVGMQLMNIVFSHLSTKPSIIFNVSKDLMNEVRNARQMRTSGDCAVKRAH